jgi:hypothetical protein
MKENKSYNLKINDCEVTILFNEAPLTPEEETAVDNAKMLLSSCFKERILSDMPKITA